MRMQSVTSCLGEFDRNCYQNFKYMNFFFLLIMDTYMNNSELLNYVKFSMKFTSVILSFIKI